MGRRRDPCASSSSLHNPEHKRYKHNELTRRPVIGRMPQFCSLFHFSPWLRFAPMINDQLIIGLSERLNVFQEVTEGPVMTTNNS